MTEKSLPQALYPFLDSIKDYSHGQEGRCELDNGAHCEWDLCLEAVRNWAEAYSGHESRLRPLAKPKRIKS